MNKPKQLRYIDQFLNGNLNKKELRKLVVILIHDDTMMRNFRLHTSMKGIFL